MQKRSLLRMAVSLVLLLTNNRAVRAIVTSDVIGSHAVMSGEAFGVNLDGVALLGGIGAKGLLGGQCTGALISDRHVLTAAHCFDGEADLEIDPFWYHIDSLIGTSAMFVVEGDPFEVGFDPENVQWPSTWGEYRSDIAIVTLDEDAPEFLPRYRVYAGANEIGQPFVLAGFGNAGYGATGEDLDFDPEPVKRAGLNRYEWLYRADEENEFLVYDFDNDQQQQNALASTGVESDLGFGADEVMSAGRDSGGPGFLNGAIASVMAFGDRIPSADVTDVLDSSWGEGSFDLRVSNYRDFIATATDGQAEFVPEPTLTNVWLVFASIQVTRRRRDCPRV